MSDKEILGMAQVYVVYLCLQNINTNSPSTVHLFHSERCPHITKKDKFSTSNTVTQQKQNNSISKIPLIAMLKKKKKIKTKISRKTRIRKKITLMPRMFKKINNY